MTENGKRLKRERNRRYYQKNKERISEQSKKHYRANSIKIRERAHNYYWANRDEIRKKCKVYTLLTKDRKRAYDKVYLQKKREYIKLRRKAYRERNDAVIKLKKKLYAKANRKKIQAYKTKWLKNNPNMRLAHLLRDRARTVIKKYGLEKSYTASVDLLGTSPIEAVKYIESKFQPNMTWENWGLFGWHIDHIRPLSSFDLSNPEELSKAFHYTNLQPLWAKENLKKRNKITI